VTVVSDLAEALEQKPDAAVVVTSPHTHAAVTRLTLEHGVPTLVEKPFVLDAREATALIEFAEQQGLVLGVGLHLLMASYLSYFHSLWADRRISYGRLIWFDPAVESRYGEEKTADVWTPKVHDIFPHLWSILHVLLPEAQPTIDTIRSAPHGAVDLRLDVGGVEIEAKFGRRASERLRRVEFRFQDGGNSMLDFTHEPGIIMLDGAKVASDPEWGRTPSPLMAEVASFLNASNDIERARRAPWYARKVLGAVRHAQEAATRLSACEALVAARLLASGNDPATQRELAELLSDNLLPEFAALGLRMHAPPSERLLVLTAVVALHSLDGMNASCPAEVAPDIFDATVGSKFLSQLAAVRASVS
jgi:predicted dehydrogenase